MLPPLPEHSNIGIKNHLRYFGPFMFFLFFIFHFSKIGHLALIHPCAKPEIRHIEIILAARLSNPKNNSVTFGGTFISPKNVLQVYRIGTP